jgi:hypothetical protein
MSNRSRRHPRRGPRPHETAKLDQTMAGLRDITTRYGIKGVMRAAANGEQCEWCSCPMEHHMQYARRMIANGLDPTNAQACLAAFRADPLDCAGCRNPALSMWILTDDEVRYPICAEHESDFAAHLLMRYPGNALVVPQQIYDNDII